jgi:hypothetical protein
MAFEPVELVKGDQKRTPETAIEDTKLRFDGWHPKLAEKQPEAPEPPAADGGETPKPAPKSKPTSN